MDSACYKELQAENVRDAHFSLYGKKLVVTVITIFIVTLLGNIYHIYHPNRPTHRAMHGNESSHVELLRAIVLGGRVNIHYRGMDMAVYKGRRYSNKPPGFAFLLSGPYWVYTNIVKEKKVGSTIVFIKYCNAVFGALSVSALVIYFAAYNLRFASIIYGVVAVSLGTIFPAYRVLANSASLSVMLVVWALLFYRLFIVSKNKPLFWSLSLFCATYSLIVDYSNGFFLMPLFIAYLWQVYKQKKLLLYSLVCIVPIGLLFMYNYIAFNELFVLSYSHYRPPAYVEWSNDKVSANFAFSNIPRGLFGLLFSLSRGIFVLSPVCILGAFAIIHLFLRKKNCVLVWVVIIGILISSSYSLWHGGHCVGYRHGLIGAIALAMLSAFSFNKVKFEFLKISFVLILILSSFSGFMSFYIQGNEQLLRRTWKKEPQDIHSHYYSELLYKQLKMYHYDGAGVNKKYPFKTDTLPKHKLQLWKLSSKHFGQGRYIISVKHAAGGELGAFYITAWADTDNDGIPDTEIGHSDKKISDKRGIWSSWECDIPYQEIYVGNYWDNFPQKIYYTSRLAYESWKRIDNTMYFSMKIDNPSFKSISPRYTNIQVQKIE